MARNWFLPLEGEGVCTANRLTECHGTLTPEVFFIETGATHLPVMETTERNGQRLRGLLFFAKVKRLLVDIA